MFGWYHLELLLQAGLMLEADGVEFDAFMEINSDQAAPGIRSEVFVEKGFFLQVSKPHVH